MAVQPNNRIPDVNRKIGPLTKSDLRVIEEDLANILKYNAFMSDSFTYFIKSAKESKRTEEEDRKGLFELRRSALRTSLATEETSKSNRKVERSTLSHHRTSERQGSDMIRSMHGLSRGLEKFSPRKQLDQINSMMVNSYKAYGKLGDSYVDIHKAILEEQAQEKEKVYDGIMKSIKDQMEALLANNKKLQTEEGQKRLEELANAHKKMLDLQKKEGKTSGSKSGFGGRSRGGRSKGRSSFGSDDDEDGFAGDWIERTKARIKKSFVDKMVEVTEPLKKGKEFITGKKTKTKFEIIQEKLEEKRKYDLEKEQEGKDRIRNINTEPILDSVIEILKVKKQKKVPSDVSKKDVSRKSKEIPTVKTIESPRKQRKYTPTTANIKKNNPEIYWLAKGDVKESDETQLLLKDIKSKSGGGGKGGGGLLDIIATVGSFLWKGVAGLAIKLGESILGKGNPEGGPLATTSTRGPSVSKPSASTPKLSGSPKPSASTPKPSGSPKPNIKPGGGFLNNVPGMVFGALAMGVVESGREAEKDIQDKLTKMAEKEASGQKLTKDETSYLQKVFAYDKNWMRFYIGQKNEASIKQTQNKKSKGVPEGSVPMTMAMKNDGFTDTLVSSDLPSDLQYTIGQKQQNQIPNAAPPMSKNAVDAEQNIQKKTIEKVATATDTEEKHKMWIQDAFQSITDAFIKNTNNIGASGLGATSTQNASSKGELDRSEKAQKIRKEKGELNDGIVRNDGTVVKINEKDNVYATTKNLEVDKRSNTSNTDNRIRETKVFTQPKSTTMAQANLGSAREAGVEVAKAMLIQQQNTNQLIEKLVSVITKNGKETGTTIINNQVNELLSVGTIMQKLGGV